MGHRVHEQDVIPGFNRGDVGSSYGHFLASSKVGNDDLVIVRVDVYFAE
ncbi:hypothetical protein ONA92_02135 [Mycobacteroides salmoniphilum]